MTYRPSEEFFGPPWRQRTLALVHGGVAALVFGVLALAQAGHMGGDMHAYFFRRQHLMDPYVAAGFFALSAVLSILRDSMRGVQIKAAWLEYRDMISSVWPRVRRYRWAQIEAISFEASGHVSLDLWDGRREFLPEVQNNSGLKLVLTRVAQARGIPLRGNVPEAELDAAA